MRQLVGQNCVHCQARISSDLDGRFCRACGCPVHKECAIPRKGQGCETCGASAADAASNAAGAAHDAKELATAPKPWDAPGHAPFTGTLHELRLYRRCYLGLSLCLGGMVYIVTFPGRDDGGAGIMIGAVTLLIGGLLLYFSVRRIVKGNQAPPSEKN
jgi:hypothetical protein